MAGEVWAWICGQLFTPFQIQIKNLLRRKKHFTQLSNLPLLLHVGAALCCFAAATFLQNENKNKDARSAINSLGAAETFQGKECVMCIQCFFLPKKKKRKKKKINKTNKKTMHSWKNNEFPPKCLWCMNARKTNAFVSRKFLLHKFHERKRPICGVRLRPEIPYTGRPSGAMESLSPGRFHARHVSYTKPLSRNSNAHLELAGKLKNPSNKETWSLWKLDVLGRIGAKHSYIQQNRDNIYLVMFEWGSGCAGLKTEVQSAVLSKQWNAAQRQHKEPAIRCHRWPRPWEAPLIYRSRSSALQNFTVDLDLSNK